MAKNQKQPDQNGRNRQERRANGNRPAPGKSAKPLGLRIVILVIMIVMLLGIVLLPLLQLVK